ncbi:MAG: hypothetical protein ACFCUE_01940 [Candidatus Bathyarchaeia archaeon]
MSEIVYNKPVVCIFKERDVHPEVDPFVVVKAKKITLNKTKDSKFDCKMQDFFTLMGDADYLSSPEGEDDHYVMCWFDDTQPDMTHDLRRLRGVTLKGQPKLSYTQSGKRTYNAAFEAKQAKL